MQSEVIRGYEVSAQQKRVWLLQQDSKAYCAQTAILLEGRVSVTAMKQGLRRVIARHEILRTSFHRKAGMRIPIQVVNEQGGYVWKGVKRRGLDKSQQAEAVEREMESEREEGFDFESGPMVRASLIELSDERQVLILSVPAVCADGKAMANIVEDLSRFYEASLPDTAFHDLPVQYVDYSSLQNELLRGEEEDAKQGRAYWSKQEMLSKAALRLPLEAEAKHDSRFAPSRVEVEISEQTANRLEAVARRYASGLEAVLLASWAVLVWRLSGEAEIVIGELYGGRKYEELEEAVGLYGRWVPVQLDMERGMRFTELIEQVDESKRLASEWQEYYTVEGGANESASGRLPAISFEYEHPSESYTSGAVKFGPYRQYSCFEGFKLKLSCMRRDDSLSIEIHYDSSLFELNNAERIAGYFKSILEDVVQNPESLLSDLNLLSGKDRNQLLCQFNQTYVSYDANKNIHQLFEEQVRRTPDSIAVISGSQHLTYAGLNSRANQLAHLLRRAGVTADVRVGLCVERCADMIIGILATLKAGGAYVPLNSENSKERLAHQIEEIQTPLLITQEKWLSRLPVFEGEIICLDRDQSLYWNEPESNPEALTSPKNLVYVMYTSGSSGVPKGVAITHESLLNYTNFICSELRLNDAPVTQALHFATVSTISADLGNTVIFPSLVSGGCLHILSYEVATDAELFAEYASRHPIDVLKIVPSHLSALLTASEPSRVLPRKYLILGGEALPSALLERLHELSADCQVVNHYGPTEATVGALLNRADRNTDRGEPPLNSLSATVPIGWPMANTEAFILDESFRPVPIGVAGELYLGGAGLARGYLNQPAQTAERFVPHPFSDQSARLYRTGDLSRYLPDGKVEFLDRVDDQVKIRGFRVELGEIETILRQHASVKEAIVLAREDEFGHKSLVAYAVAEKKVALTTKELHSYLKEKLPEYMLPAAFVMLEQIPLTLNGKIDRKALPTLEQARSELSKSYTAAGTDTERILAAIWQDVLRLNRVGIHDNFFELGGDSILSIQIVAKARQAGLHLTPKQLFQCQTIAELALVATPAMVLQAEQGLVTGAAPLTPIQHWFFHQELDNPNHFNQATLFRVQPDLDASVLRQAIGHLVEHHDALRLRFTETEHGWQQHHASFDEAIPFASVDLSDLAEGEQSAAIEAAATTWQLSLHLDKGPLLRVVLFSLGAKQVSRLLIVAHHLVIDGVSWRILLDDLHLACEQIRSGLTVRLPAKTTSFKQWAERLRDYSHSTELKAEAEYWLDLVGRGGGNLPVDYPEGTNSRETTRIITVALTEAETDALLREVPAVYHTEINDVLLTALARAVVTWSGQRAVLVEMEGHGREEIGEDLNVTRTVGWFTTHYPLLLETSEKEDRAEALKRIKEQLRAVPKHGLGYGLLRWIGSDQSVARQLQQGAIPQIKFNYLGQIDKTVGEGSAFAMADESSGESRSSGGQRNHLLEINGVVIRQRLQLRWAYSEQIHRRATIEALAASYIAQLRALIHDCRFAETSGYTPSDFPAAQLKQKELDRLIAGLNSSDTNISNRKDDGLEDLYRLSPMQEGLLFHSLYAPESDVYFRQMSCSLHGDLDIPAFEQAWQGVLDQHPVLRTSFHWQNLEAPVQMVSKRVKLSPVHHDLRGLSSAEQEQRLESLLEAERERGFDLTLAPLMRLILIRLDGDVYHLIWSYHHLLMDGWSKHSIFNQILAAYKALSQGRSVERESTRPYGDYIRWLQKQDMQEAEAFWRRTLKGFTTPNVVDAESPQKKSADEEFKSRPLSDKQRRLLSEEATAALQDLARKHQLTMNTVVQGAWALLLSHYSHQPDVVFGAVVSGRPASLDGAETMTGLFINTLPVRVQVEPEDLVVQWLKQLLQQQAEMRQYEYSPLVDAQRWSEVSRGASLFESVLAFENYPLDASARQQNMTFEVRNVRVVENNSYPLTLMAGPGTRLSLLLIYDLSRFQAGIITRMLENLETLLISIASISPEGRLTDLQAALDEAIRRQEMLSEKAMQVAGLQKLKSTKRKAVQRSSSVV